MKNVARISCDGGGLVIPASTPYDRELVFEHAGQTARRHGRVQLEINDDQWVVTFLGDGQSCRCSVCGKRNEHIVYHGHGHEACSLCARKSSERVRHFLRWPVHFRSTHAPAA